MSRATSGRTARDAGFALLIVLWSLVLVALLLTGLTSEARSDARRAANLRSAAELEAVADGAISTAMFRLLPGAGGVSEEARSDGIEVRVAAASLAGRLNPNTASPELLRALMVRLGVDPGRAGQIAAAMADWRTPGRTPRPGGAKSPQYRAAGLRYGPPGAPFESLDELDLVLGMTPDLRAAMAPHLTLFWDGAPDLGLADQLVRAALRDVGVAQRPGRAAYDVLRITASVRRADGSHAAREAVVRIGASGNRRLWRVLAWGAAT